MRKLNSTTRWIARAPYQLFYTAITTSLTHIQNLAISPVCADPESRIKTNRRVERGSQRGSKKKRESSTECTHRSPYARASTAIDESRLIGRYCLKGFQRPRAGVRSCARNCEKETGNLGGGSGGDAVVEEDPHRSAKNQPTKKGKRANTAKFRQRAR